jgi:hypothetical protein
MGVSLGFLSKLLLRGLIINERAMAFFYEAWCNEAMNWKGPHDAFACHKTKIRMEGVSTAEAVFKKSYMHRLAEFSNKSYTHTGKNKH